MKPKSRPLKILTWHIHGSYLYYLVKDSPHTFYLPTKPNREHGYGGRAGSWAWPDRVIEVPAEGVRDLPLDLILFQARKNYFEDQFEILTDAQRKLPRVYLEHDPPREHPTDTCHPLDDPNTLLVHVTPFNDLMWESRGTPTLVIEHGVVIPKDPLYSGKIPKGIVVINQLKKRGRRLGADIFLKVKEGIPLDLIGMEAELLGGLGEVPHQKLALFEADYRFFFNPIRYTSLGLAVLEAMAIGMPIVGLGTTEMATVIENGVSGYVDTRLKNLVDGMRNLLKDPQEARTLGIGARRRALERFSIKRFTEDWNRAFSWVTT